MGMVGSTPVFNQHDGAVVIRESDLEILKSDLELHRWRINPASSGLYHIRPPQGVKYDTYEFTGASRQSEWLMETPNFKFTIPVDVLSKKSPMATIIESTPPIPDAE